MKTFFHILISFYIVGAVLSSAVAETSQGIPSSGSEAGNPYLFIALGDSITLGFNALTFSENRQYSWATGNGLPANEEQSTEFQSHLLKLQSIYVDRPIDTMNLAIAGGTVDELAEQVEKIEDENKSPDYVTITIGANDVCGWDDSSLATQRETFEKSLNESLQSLVDRNNKIKILVAPVPDMNKLYELGNDQSCREFRDWSGFCQPLLGWETTDADRKAFAERVIAINDSIDNVASQFRENVKFDRLAANLDYEQKHLSKIDCFHPSVEGQNLMSDRLWESGWYGN